MMRAVLLALFLAIATSPAIAREPALVGVASLIDGDTIEIHGRRIRLHGIDAPESRQECQRPNGTKWRCGQQVALALEKHIGRSPIRCQPGGRDRYRRIIAVCFRGAEDLNRWMVANGWAVAYRRFSRDYVAAEQSARRAKVGIWSGTFVMPWDWRANRGR